MYHKKEQNETAGRCLCQGGKIAGSAPGAIHNSLTNIHLPLKASQQTNDLIQTENVFVVKLVNHEAHHDHITAEQDLQELDNAATNFSNTPGTNRLDGMPHNGMKRLLNR